MTPSSASLSTSKERPPPRAHPTRRADVGRADVPAEVEGQLALALVALVNEVGIALVKMKKYNMVSEKEGDVERRERKEREDEPELHKFRRQRRSGGRDREYRIVSPRRSGRGTV